MPRLDELLTEEEMEAFLQRAAKEGYASGREPEQGYLPGVKTLPEHTEEIRGIKLVINDSWVGRGGTGGQSLVLYSQNNEPLRPGFLVQYHGGQPLETPLERVREVNAFLRRALSHIGNCARAPSQRVAQYRSDDVGLTYWGVGRGNVWNLRWIEVITLYDHDWDRPHPFYRSTDPTMVYLDFQKRSTSALFWHYLTHQLVW